MSGGKGGGSTTSVEVPEYIERAAQRNLNKAEGISQLGYVPQYGPDVAAFTPNQQSAFQNTSDAANAFGMSTPTNQQDIMGGMGAPTEYANGVQGYSSQPMFQQSVDQFQAERPGQFDHMNSFFIDPFTGQAGSNVSAPVNYENYATSAQNNRDQAQAERNQADAQRGNDLAIAQAQAGAGPESYYNYSNVEYSPTSNATSNITNPASGITDTSPAGFGEGAVNDAKEAVIGLGSVFDPSLKVGAINNPIGTPTVGEMAAAAPPGMDYNPTTGGYTSNTTSGLASSSRPQSREDGDPDGGTTVICTSMHTLGLISDDVYNLDAEFGEIINEADPSLLAGYRLWATPVADYILGNSLGSKLALSVVTPLATSWAAQMAHVMRPKKYKPNRLGMIVMFVGHPICRLAGYMSPRGGNLIKKGA
jgi:hypothetical protein